MKNYEVRLIPPYTSRTLYERNRLDAATFSAGGTVAKLRDPRHEAALARIGRQLESARLRREQWRPARSFALGAALVILMIAAGLSAR